MTLTKDLVKKPSLISEFKLIRCSHKLYEKLVQTIQTTPVIYKGKFFILSPCMFVTFTVITNSCTIN